MRVGANTPITAIPPGGTVGQVLLSTGTQSYSWQYAPTAAADFPLISGQWLDSAFLAVSASPNAVVPTAGQTYFSPIYIPQATTITGLAIATASAWTASGTVNLRVYDSAASGGPGNFLGGGTVTASAVSTVFSVTTSIAVSAGWNFLAAGSAAPPAGMYLNFRLNGSHCLVGDSTVQSAGSSGGWRDPSGVALANGSAAVISSVFEPLIMYRVA